MMMTFLQRRNFPGQFLCVEGLCRFFWCFALLVVSGSARASAAPPEPVREFRAFWIVTLKNHDWPSRPGLSVAEQKQEMVRILNWATQLRMNAVILQVRQSADAIYPSSFEPWSEALTGQMGQSPGEGFDPLQFAVEEAHRRGLELHAWFNPFRARHVSAKSAPSAGHVSQRYPQFVKSYNGYQWLDPGEPEVQKYSLRVILDVLRRYDVDGIHLDDYFYPYKDAKQTDFPDDASWARYQRTGGKLSRDDWRRDNVNRFVYSLNHYVHEMKPWVKFGISPFGIWRPGYPEQIKGKDAYAEIYADSFRWFSRGWVDYLSPQLYWKIDDHDQSYPALLSWWSAQNFQKRHLWPGNIVSNVDTSGWSPAEIVRQIAITEQMSGATGNVLFRAATLMNTKNGLADALLRNNYQEPALVPASPWLSTETPKPPTVTRTVDRKRGLTLVEWNVAVGERPWLWLVQTRRGDKWSTEVLAAHQRLRTFANDVPLGPDEIAVRSVNRYGNLSAPKSVKLK